MSSAHTASICSTGSFEALRPCLLERESALLPRLRGGGVALDAFEAELVEQRLAAVEPGALPQRPSRWDASRKNSVYSKW